MGANNELVLGWWREARALEGHAEALLGSLYPEALAQLRPARSQAEKTRGPFQERLRATAVALRARPVVEALADADALYWRMVGVWDRLQRRWAGRIAEAWHIQADDALQIMRLGWFRTAMRWQPERGRYQSAAWAWARQELSRAPEVQVGGIRLTRGAPSGQRVMVSLQEAVPGHDRDHAATYEDALEDRSEPREFRHDLDSVRSRLMGLPVRQREVMERRYYGEDLVSLAEVGTAMGLTRERARQLEVLAVQNLHAKLKPRAGRPYQENHR